MKRTAYFQIFSLFLLTPFLTGCSFVTPQAQTDTQTEEPYVVDQSDYLDGEEIINTIGSSELTDVEREGLILMREEEKLARDVYTVLGETWGAKIFSNIAASEQTHTDAVKALLSRYSMTDPVKQDTVGVFTSQVMTNLYEQLTTQGKQSLLDALVVSATIEDLDIKDLENLMDQTDNEDILATYANLQKGSRNHIRAYVRQIENNGGMYLAQYISQEKLNDIISSSQERGRVRQ